MTQANAKPQPLRVTFVLPGRGRSGGVRVTAVMANRLVQRGHQVRIAYRSDPAWSTRRLSAGARWLTRRLAGITADDWLSDFQGQLVPFARLQQVSFEPGEIVIAVGSHVSGDVHQLSPEVIKVRYCHGISTHNGRAHPAWSLPMRTITVSPTLVGQLEELSGKPVDAVVPNGIDQDQYFEQDHDRDGIGAVYSTSPRKDPGVLRAALAHVREADPAIQRYVFGIERPPPELEEQEYSRYPAVARARELYNRSRVWVIPSISEGFCLPILEAMACGAAVVSTDHDTVRGLIEPDVNGILVPVGDAQTLARQALRVFHDRTLRERLIEASRQTVEQFRWEASVSKMERYLQGLVTQRSEQRQPAVTAV